MVRADRGDVELREPLGRLARRHAGERLGALVEGHQRDDRQARDAAHRLDRVDELVEVVERLDHEEVGAAALEDRSPARANSSRRTREVADSPSGPIEPAMKTSRPEISRASRASLTAGRVDPLEVVLEEVAGELAPVRAERVRLDQLGAGVDEADVERDDGLRARGGSPPRASAAAGTAAVISEPMPPSATIGGPASQPGQKPVRHGVKLVKSGGQVRNG